MVAQITSARLRPDEPIHKNEPTKTRTAVQRRTNGPMTYGPSRAEYLLTDRRTPLRGVFTEAIGRTAQRGDIVIRAGDSAPPILHIQRGVAFSSHTLPDGRRAITDVLLPTDFVGIEHVVTGRASAETTAASPLGYKALPASALRQRCIADPKVALRLLAALSEQTGRRDRHALALSRLDARERLADFIIGMYDRLRRAGLIGRATFNFPLTQDQIADHLGMTTVHVSRTCKRLREERLVTVDRQIIIITDADGLREAAGELQRSMAR